MTAGRHRHTSAWRLITVEDAEADTVFISEGEARRCITHVMEEETALLGAFRLRNPY
jgi:hypothetical protein